MVPVITKTCADFTTGEYLPPKALQGYKVLVSGRVELINSKKGTRDSEPANLWAELSSVRDLHPAGRSRRHLNFSVTEII